MKVAQGKKVKIEYSLSIEGVGIIESSEARGPLEYVQGSGALPFGLEGQLVGLAVGETKEGSFEVELPTMDMKKSSFPAEFRAEPGLRFSGKKDGQDIEFTVVSVKGDSVMVRPVHPLAGKKLSYKFKILEVLDQA
jgi:FKBP-type peptidyl-prolyl cis-trans isomerase SlyD